MLLQPCSALMMAISPVSCNSPHVHTSFGDQQLPSGPNAASHCRKTENQHLKQSRERAYSLRPHNAEGLFLQTRCCPRSQGTGTIAQLRST